MFLSITGTENGKVSKYQKFDNEADANALAENWNGFVVPDPGESQEFWIVDDVEQTVVIDTIARDAYIAAQPIRDLILQITALEQQQTPRRIREAALGIDGGWLASLDGDIELLRDQLV